MTSTAVLRTPPASTSRRNDYISLRPPRGGKEKDLRREASLSPTISMQRVKSPPERSFGDSPSQPSPSPLSRRVLFERGSNRQYDSDDDDDDEPSPSLTRLHSPFASHCASPFLGAWASHGSQPTPSGQPIEDDEGPFLISKAKTTPRNHTHPAVPRNASSRTPSFAKLIFTPSAPQKQALVTLSPLRRVSRPRAPQTPAETEWHLGRQTDSMKKLSIGEDDHLGRQPKYQVTNSSTKDQESSPSPISRRRGRKRLFNGNELPRASGGIFETLVDTPVASSFHIPEPPSPTTRLKSSTDAIFGPPAHTSPGSYIKSPPLNITLTGSPAVTPVRNSSPKLTLDLIAKKYRPRDSGIGG
ncbi:hypothetical protein JB92DRAFT_1433219 [Gautieria morchelliformis]|nr:hypothetical protein JB92DRAFT_1433219 [Gautieria morchelliformis]